MFYIKIFMLFYIKMCLNDARNFWLNKILYFLNTVFFILFFFKKNKLSYSNDKSYYFP